MNTDIYHYLLTVAKTRNITRAAEMLHISQPALTKAIRRQEKELGVTLFDRTTSPLTLTYAGERFLESARKLLDIGTAMREEMKNIASGAKERVRTSPSDPRRTSPSQAGRRRSPSQARAGAADTRSAPSAQQNGRGRCGRLAPQAQGGQAILCRWRSARAEWIRLGLPARQGGSLSMRDGLAQGPPRGGSQHRGQAARRATRFRRNTPSLHAAEEARSVSPARQRPLRPPPFRGRSAPPSCRRLRGSRAPSPDTTSRQLCFQEPFSIRLSLKKFPSPLSTCNRQTVQHLKRN